MSKKTLVVLLLVFVIMLLTATAAFAGGDYCNYNDGSPGPGYSDLGSFVSTLAQADQGIGSSNALRSRHGNSACLP